MVDRARDRVPRDGARRQCREHQVVAGEPAAWLRVRWGPCEGCPLANGGDGLLNAGKGDSVRCHDTTVPIVRLDGFRASKPYDAHERGEGRRCTAAMWGSGGEGCRGRIHLALTGSARPLEEAAVFPPPTGPVPNVEQVRELDDSFFASDPFGYFRARIESLIACAQGAQVDYGTALGDDYR